MTAYSIHTHTATLYIWRLSPPSPTQDHTMPQLQGPHNTVLLTHVL